MFRINTVSSVSGRGGGEEEYVWTVEKQMLRFQLLDL
jgi:hypothetical protein